jgi:thiol-disulfide isomerase/thioredoxin
MMKGKFFNWFVNPFILLFLYLIIGGFFTSEHKWLLFLTQIGLVFIYFSYQHLGIAKKLEISIGVFSVLILIGMLYLKDFSRGGLYLIFIPLVYKLLAKMKSLRVGLPLLLLFITVNSFVLFPNYFEQITGYRSPKSVGKNISSLKLLDENGDIAQLEYRGYIVLDFWTTSCGVCFKKFPLLNKLVHKYDEVKFYAVNVPIDDEENLERRVKIIENYNYSFHLLFAENRKVIENLLNFNQYPQIFLVKDGRILRTDLSLNERHVIINNLDYELDRRLN